jgi:hypothetical protein
VACTWRRSTRLTFRHATVLVVGGWAAVCVASWLRTFPDTIGWLHLGMCTASIGAFMGWITHVALYRSDTPLPAMQLFRIRVQPTRPVVVAVGLLALGLAGHVLVPHEPEPPPVEETAGVDTPAQLPPELHDRLCGTE